MNKLRSRTELRKFLNWNQIQHPEIASQTLNYCANGKACEVVVNECGNISFPIRHRGTSMWREQVAPIFGIPLYEGLFGRGAFEWMELSLVSAIVQVLHILSKGRRILERGQRIYNFGNIRNALQELTRIYREEGDIVDLSFSCNTPEPMVFNDEKTEYLKSGTHFNGPCRNIQIYVCTDQ